MCYWETIRGMIISLADMSRKCGIGQTQPNAWWPVKAKTQQHSGKSEENASK